MRAAPAVDSDVKRPVKGWPASPSAPAGAGAGADPRIGPAPARGQRRTAPAAAAPARPGPPGAPRGRAPPDRGAGPPGTRPRLATGANVGAGRAPAVGS